MRDFSKIYKEDLDIVGKRAVELAEIARLGIPIPDGFVITPFLHLSENLIIELHSAYRKLSGLFKETSLNIFTSPLKGKSLQFSNVKGDTNLILKIKEIWASQIHKPVAIIVQKNIQGKTKGTTTTKNPIKELEHIAYKIQKHFYFPKVLDYTIVKNKIYVTKLRPFTGKVEELRHLAQNIKVKKVLIKGISINPGIVTGPVKVFRENSDPVKTLSGEIIVLPRLDASSYEKIKRAKAIVIDNDLSSSYRMLYRKDIKIPTIIRTKNAAKILQNGDVVTVNGISGEIYSGSLI